MQYDTLLLETSGHLSTITLNRPEKRNAITTQMIADLQTALDLIEKTNTRVVILTGTGKAFCAGIDLEYCKPSRSRPRQKTRMIPGASRRCSAKSGATPGR